MATSAYKINKGINRPIEFRGLKGQYILYAGVLLVADLIFFAVLYLCGLNSYICLIVVGGIGFLGIGKTYRLSRQYGPYGYLKKNARKRLPSAIRSFSRKAFTDLNKNHETNHGAGNARLRDKG
jgi:Domain of unknown function (DUF4133)